MWPMMKLNKTFDTQEDKMLYVNGRKTSYRCHCGCNVFRQVSAKPKRYKCNSCGSLVIGE